MGMPSLRLALRNLGIPSWGLYIDDSSIVGSIVGSPISGKLPLALHSPKTPSTQNPKPKTQYPQPKTQNPKTRSQRILALRGPVLHVELYIDALVEVNIQAYGKFRDGAFRQPSLTYLERFPTQVLGS